MGQIGFNAFLIHGGKFNSHERRFRAYFTLIAFDAYLLDTGQGGISHDFEKNVSRVFLK